MSTMAISGASPTKARRRSKADINAINSAIIDLLADEKPMTVRQVFYRLVSEGIIGKTETEYKSTVCRLLAQLRREKVIPFNWIADNTRWMRKPKTYDSLAEMLDLTQQTYRRAVWSNQDCYVEVWLEKDALSGVLSPITFEWDVPLMVTRGYPSLSFLHSAGEAIAEQEGRTCYVYYFGDHDPSGVDIPKKVEAALGEFAPRVSLRFQCVAVLPEQIEAWNLPTRPTKKSDSRSKSFKGESVEVDAIPPTTLRGIVENCILQHIDVDALAAMDAVETAERETLRTIIESINGEAA